MRIYIFFLFIISIFRVYAINSNDINNSYSPGQSINPYSPIFYNVCNIDNGYATIVTNINKNGHHTSSGILLKADLINNFAIHGVAFIADINTSTGKSSCLKSDLQVGLSNYYNPMKYSSGGGIDLYMMPGSICNGQNCTLVIGLVNSGRPISEGVVGSNTFSQP